eukprot:355604-Chlamydomonas_euryale.AAC.6
MGDAADRGGSPGAAKAALARGLFLGPKFGEGASFKGPVGAEDGRGVGSRSMRRRGRAVYV